MGAFQSLASEVWLHERLREKAKAGLRLPATEAALKQYQAASDTSERLRGIPAEQPDNAPAAPANVTRSTHGVRY